MRLWPLLTVCSLVFADVGELLAQDAAVLQQEGREARRAGRLAEAVERLTDAATLRPDDADIQVELGLALTPLKRYAEAEKALRRALELAPDYLDARLGLARLAYFRKQFAKALNDVRMVLAKRPADTDARELEGQIKLAVTAQRTVTAQRAAAAKRAVAGARKEKEKVHAESAAARPAAIPAKRWLLDLEGSHSQLTGDRKDWLEGNARIAYAFSPETAVSVAVQAARRFEISDTYIEGRIDHRATPWLSGQLSVGGTPNADFLPEFAVAGKLGARLYKLKGPVSATVLTMEGRHADYTTGPVQTIAPGVEQYLFDGRFWVTAKWINTFVDPKAFSGPVPIGTVVLPARHLQGYFLRGDIVLREDVRLFGGYSDAPETSEGITVQTRTMFGGVVWDLDAVTALRASLAHEKRPGLYDRTVVSLGMSYRF